MEVRVARIWADILGLPSIGRHEGFFDIGGHSLLAVQLAGHMRDVLQTEVPLAALFQYPTVAAMAEWLELERTVPVSPFVVVRKGKGDGPPLYLFHTGTGHVWGYESLIKALDPGDPISGIQMRAVDNPAIEVQDFGAVVEDYLEILRSRHPGGSYRLLGWSLGGLIALGVASRLRESGANVDFLGLIDTHHPRKFEKNDWRARLTEFLQDPEDRARLAALPGPEIRELEHILSGISHSERPARVALWGRERGLWLNEISIEILRLETSLWRHVAAIEDTFVAPRFAGDLHVWWARNSAGPDGVACVDWASLSGAHTAAKFIDGDHNTIIESADLHASVRVILAGLDG